jgi:uncharacterized protein
MTDMNNLNPIPLSTASELDASPSFAPQAEGGQWIGRVLNISGSSATIEFDSARLHALANDPDPSVAMSGQVGSQVRLQAQRHWLLANVRSLSASPDGNAVLAEVDFLGEGDEDPHSGQFTNFRRGVTTYSPPIRCPAAAPSR